MLVVASAPDRRAAAWSRLDIEAELARREGVRVTRWYLRPDPAELLDTDDSVVVDDLRTWLPAVLADRFIGRRLGARLRGLALRRLYAAVEPDVVILDDGRGRRIIPSGRHPVVISRRNGEAPPTAKMEPIDDDGVEVVVAPDSPEPDGGAVSGNRSAKPIRLSGRTVRDLGDARAAGAASAVAAARRRLGLPGDAFIVGGWGPSWLDGIEMFPRILWALEARHERSAVGLWIADGLADEDRRRLLAEADRCGVAERFNLVGGPDDQVLAADALVMPHRDRFEQMGEIAGSLPRTLLAIGSGLPVAAFAAARLIEDEAVTVVADLDVEGIAAAVAHVDPTARSERIESARQRLDVGPFVDELLGAIGALRSS